MCSAVTKECLIIKYLAEALCEETAAPLGLGLDTQRTCWEAVIGMQVRGSLCYTSKSRGAGGGMNPSANSNYCF